MDITKEKIEQKAENRKPNNFFCSTMILRINIRDIGNKYIIRKKNFFDEL